MGNRIRRGDMVEVIEGNDRGVRGEILRINLKKGRVVVSGVGIVKKHQRPVRAGRGQVQPGIIEFEASIDASKVMLVCPHARQSQFPKANAAQLKPTHISAWATT